MMKPLKGPSGQQVATYNPPTWGNNTFIITKNCKNPDLAYQIGDFLLSDEGALLTYYGEEGVDWEQAHEGDVGIDGKPASIRQLTELYNMQSQNKAWMWMAPQVDIRFIDGAWYDPENKFNESVRLYKETNEKEVPHTPTDGFIPPLTYTKEEADQLSKYETEINNYYKEMRAKFISGELSIDENWDEYVKNLNSFGLKEAIALRQSAYDRQYKK